MLEDMSDQHKALECRMLGFCWGQRSSLSVLRAQSRSLRSRAPIRICQNGARVQTGGAEGNPARRCRAMLHDIGVLLIYADRPMMKC